MTTTRNRDLPAEPIPLEVHLRNRKGYSCALPLTPLAIADALLVEEGERIALNWAVQVATLPVFRSEPSTPLQVLQGSIPEMLSETLKAVANGDPAHEIGLLDRAEALAEIHGRCRRQAGVPIDTVIMEYHLLRREVWNALWRLIDRNNARRDAIRLLQPRIDRAFDFLTATAAEAWVGGVAEERTAN